MKFLIPITVLSLATVILVSCALPTVTYTIYSESEPRTVTSSPADTFALAKTRLEITAVELDEDEDEDQRYQVVVIRTADPRIVLGITPDRKWYGVNTTLSISKVANTALVDSITTEVEDKRIEFSCD